MTLLLPNWRVQHPSLTPSSVPLVTCKQPVLWGKTFWCVCLPISVQSRLPPWPMSDYHFEVIECGLGTRWAKVCRKPPPGHSIPIHVCICNKYLGAVPTLIIWRDSDFSTTFLKPISSHWVLSPLVSPDHNIWSHYFMANRWRNRGNSGWLYFGGLQNHCRWWLQPWN